MLELVSGQKVGLGRYALVRKLGQGGMGQVWEAHDQRLEKIVALKFVPPQVQADDEALRGLRHETARAQMLAHENIIRIHDFHEVEGETAFISMEYVEGKTLSSLRSAKPCGVMSWEDLAPLTRQLCVALEYAHGKGLIHRDLKPANLMVSNQWVLKLADFGIAAVVCDSISRTTTGKTDTSGTVPYMSPQQLSGKLSRATDDIYALGATLYHLLTSRPPFFQGMLEYQIVNVDPEPIANRLKEFEIQNDVPLHVAETVLECLAKKAEDRPQSVREVWARLEIASVDESIVKIGKSQEGAATRNFVVSQRKVLTSENPAIVVSALKRGTVLIAAGVLLLVLAGFGGWYFVGKHSETPQVIVNHQPLNKSQKDKNSSKLPKAENETNRLSTGTPITSNHNLAIYSHHSQEMAVVKQVPKPGPPRSVDLGNGVKLDLVWIAPGEFLMGSPVSEANREEGETQHRVKLTQGFWIGKYEVTQRQYETVIGNNPSTLKSTNKDVPVEMVTWDEAMEFCRRLTAREKNAGRLPLGYEYRLPTEAQWEYACRAGTQGSFAGNLDEMAWSSENSERKTHLIGLKKPNGLGLYDMHGNVREWCFDLQSEYLASDAIDPSGGQSGTNRVLRGGGWYFSGRFCRSASRRAYTANTRYADLGFRCALVPFQTRLPK